MLISGVKNLFIFLLIFYCGTGISSAEDLENDEKLTSQFIGGVFHDVAFEILNSRDLSDEEIEQAIVFLVAAAELDRHSANINETILNASSHISGDKYDKWIFNAFEKYCIKDADLIVAQKAIKHFLSNCDNPRQRQAILTRLLKMVPEQNSFLRLEITNLLSNEKGPEDLHAPLAASSVPQNNKEAITARLSLPMRLPYGSEPQANLLIFNKLTKPLSISQAGPFKGNIRVDAEVNGDITAKKYELVSKKICPGNPIEPGGYISIPLNVFTGSLRQILRGCPQASLQVNFTIYLDPVVDRQGNVSSSVKGADPITKQFRRPPVIIDNKSLIETLNDISKGNLKQKIQAGRLFTGLLREHKINAGLRNKYEYFKVQPVFLNSVIVSHINNDHWMARTDAIYNMLDFRPPLNFEVTRSVSEKLDDPEWPVRMAALYLLSRTQGDSFLPVLKWKSEKDPNLNVRRLAEAILK